MKTYCLRTRLFTGPGLVFTVYCEATRMLCAHFNNINMSIFSHPFLLMAQIIPKMCPLITTKMPSIRAHYMPLRRIPRQVTSLVYQRATRADLLYCIDVHIFYSSYGILHTKQFYRGNIKCIHYNFVAYNIPCNIQLRILVELACFCFVLQFVLVSLLFGFVLVIPLKLAITQLCIDDDDNYYFILRNNVQFYHFNSDLLVNFTLLSCVFSVCYLFVTLDLFISVIS
jgi:hypothetical protein